MVLVQQPSIIAFAPGGFINQLLTLKKYPGDSPVHVQSAISVSPGTSSYMFASAYTNPFWEIPVASPTR